MPAYMFFCQVCKIRFEKLVGSQVATVICSECKSPCHRTLEGQGFSHAFEEPANPTNSGVHSYQSPSADMAVGRDAHKKWADYENKKKLKEKIRTESGTHALARVSPDVNGQVYSPMSDKAYEKRVTEGKELFRVYTESKESEP